VVPRPMRVNGSTPRPSVQVRANGSMSGPSVPVSIINAHSSNPQAHR
jgi:hypothetical protein